MEDPDEFSGIPVTRTDLLCTLGSYAVRGELLLTELVTRDEAENVKAKMKVKEQLVTSYREIWHEPAVKLETPVFFTPLITDEVWKFITSKRSWQHLAGRAGYALVRDGVMICDIVIVMA